MTNLASNRLRGTGSLGPFNRKIQGFMNIAEIDNEIEKAKTQARKAQAEMNRVNAHLRSLERAKRDAFIASVRQSKHVGLDALYRLIEVQTGVTKEELHGSNRKAEFVTARQMLSGFLLFEKKWSLEAIGREMGGRDHSTIINQIRRLKDRCEIYPAEKGAWETFRHSALKLFAERTGENSWEDVA